MIEKNRNEATTLYANKGSQGYRNTYRTDGNNGEYTRGVNFNSKKKVNWNLFCEHCKMHGHTKNICYILVYTCIYM